MARVTSSEVLAIIDTTLTSDDIDPFITAANLVVTDMTADAGYGASLLKEIERWLAAHLAAIRDPRVKSESIEESSQAFHGLSGMGLEHTPYGQQVLVLDYKGFFAEAQNAKTRADVRAIA